MKYDIRLETVAPIKLMAVRRRVSTPEISKVIVETFKIMWEFIREWQYVDVGRNVVVYLDDEINMEVGIEMIWPDRGMGEFVGSETPSGLVATTTHLGPYDRLPNVHKKIRDWCDRHGHVRAGPRWEIYGHWQDAWTIDPSQIRTDVFYLLKS